MVELAVAGYEIHHNTKVKKYPSGRLKITFCSKPIFKDERYELCEDKESEPKPKNMSNEVRKDSMDRARERIFDIAMLNDFKYFITWTLNPEKIDRDNPLAVSKKLRAFLNHAVSRNNAKYIIIPEYHKNGAIHMHGLLSGDFQLVDSGHFTKEGKHIFNMPQWSLGFSTAIELDKQKERVACYITKYVTKDFKKIFGSFYYAGGHGLERNPKVELFDSDYTAVDVPERPAPTQTLWFKYRNIEHCEEISNNTREALEKIGVIIE